MTRVRLLVIATLCLLALASYWPISENGFINYDDDKYITENLHVRDGLTPAGVRWAFTTFHANNWHPVTWISHMIDVELFGLRPERHHEVNVLMHALNGILLYLVLEAATGFTAAGALTAALFVVHPLHVESVAWAAERKDVLSALFWLLALGAYVWYCRRPAKRRLIAVSLLATLGLMTKPMLVTLPFVLLLLDFWPLGRFARLAPRPLTRLVVEKAPLFALSAASICLTLIAQQRGGDASSIAALETLPFGLRVANVVSAYLWYLVKAIWPSELAVLYPLSASMPPLTQVAGAAVVLAGISIGCFSAWRRHPGLTVGWAWYLGTLVPVIGLVQVGLQSTADRYSYLPLIGPFLVASMALVSFSRRGATQKALGIAMIAIAITALGLLANRQTRVWRDGMTLFSSAASRTRENWMTANNLGRALLAGGRRPEAIAEFEKTTRLAPHWPDGHYNLGIAYGETGRCRDGAAEFRVALSINRNLPSAHFNLGLCLVQLGSPGEALGEFLEATRLNPDHANAHFNAGLILSRSDRPGEAARELREVLRLQPGNAQARVLLSRLYSPGGTAPHPP